MTRPVWPHHGIYTLYSGDPAGLITGQATQKFSFLDLDSICLDFSQSQVGEVCKKEQLLYLLLKMTQHLGENWL